MSIDDAPSDVQVGFIFPPAGGALSALSQLTAKTKPHLITQSVRILSLNIQQHIIIHTLTHTYTCSFNK